MVAGSWHNTINQPACHMNGCLIYCLSNRNVANSESQHAVKSNTKNQMHSKQRPFIFFHFPFHKQGSHAVHENVFPLCLHVHFWCVHVLWCHCSFLAKKRQRLLLKHPQRMAHFLEGEWVSLLGCSPWTIPEWLLPEKRWHWLRQRLDQKSKEHWVERHLYQDLMDGKHPSSYPSIFFYSRKWATSDCSLLSYLFTHLFNKQLSTCCRSAGIGGVKAYFLLSWFPSSSKPSQSLWSCFSH